MHGSGTRGARVLHTRCALEAQVVRGLQDQRGGKILGGKPGVEMPEHDLVDVFCGDPGVSQRLARNFHDQTFERFTGKLAEWTVCPTDDTGRH